MIDALAPVLGLAIAAEFRPGVIANLQVAIRLARALDAVDLVDHDEPAPVFEA
ncbi:DUF4089 domain-containing protein [Phreatobacter stygius]|uniref:DUF4089 domain-containing protein n=2 Tax=Phreatobacter stygius TaxID=1940610 RepID=A0A4D7BEP0_9HYPH|nr:DUF4089 domain-containing protein [Phreatobacter stygius]